MKNISKIFFTVILFASYSGIKAEDGYRLWLRYDLISDQPVLNQYSKLISGFIVEGKTPSLKVTVTELQMGLSGLLGKKIPSVPEVKSNGIVVAGTPESSEIIASLNLKDRLVKVKEDGYLIINTVYRKKQIIVIAANKDLGVLYGTFHLLRLMQMHKDISNLAIEEYPKTKIRILNHWDNLDSSIERGYAGRSIWNWNSLPDTIPQRLV
jgi:alpha-glucuronidase